MEIGTFKRGSGQQGAPVKPRFPQLKIDHSRGEFFTPNGTSDDRLYIGKRVHFVGLGLLRSRTYWLNDGFEPRRSLGKIACSSNDGIDGKPKSDFPWDDSEFAKVASNNVLPCASCSFKGFIHGESQPRCKPMYTIPLLLVSPAQISTQAQSIDLDVNQTFVSSFTASSIPNLQNYLEPLRDHGIPVYSRVTEVSLKRLSKGGRIWTEANFYKVKDTDERIWPQYSEKLREVRDYMQPKNEGTGFTPLKLK